MRPISEVIIHSSATRPGWMDQQPLASQVQEIRRWHKANGWKDIGYHYLIGRTGEVLPGRPLEQVGAHTRGKNTGTVGVCLIGGHGSAATDRFADNYTPAQEKALRLKLRALDRQFPGIRISGHNEYAAKACPGFNVQEWLKPGRGKANLLQSIIRALMGLLGRKS